MVDITNHRSNRTALMLAAERNNREIVELLLRRGARPNLKNFNGKTAIFRGVEEGGLEVVRVVTAPQRGMLESFRYFTKGVYRLIIEIRLA
jgi:hypothetical protein